MVALWLAGSLVDAIGFWHIKSAASSAGTAFDQVRHERDAHAGWLVQDAQSARYATIAVLRDPSQRALEDATWQAAQRAHQRALTELALSANGPLTPALAAGLAVTRRDLARYTSLSLALTRPRSPARCSERLT